ncbi:MAG TPA: ArsC family reductase [Methylotenera sp.]|nr:ArsC family reductase [Methylotenera sp.]HPH05293.1 ArsC family reductase [Methylotenera sp.]HPN00195.1 ArsC family reductase [Methylotenera sp.]
MQLFGIPNCNTVKKARDWLDQHNIVYTFHDFKKNGVSQALLENWLSQMPWGKLVNRAGMTWRNLSEPEKAAVVDVASAMQLMQAKTSVIKRPILVKSGKILALGFDESNYQKIHNI